MVEDLTGPTSGLRVRTGCDLVRVADVDHARRRYGRRYLQRVFTEREQSDSAGPDAARRLAARFAAKEAVVKALRAGDVMGPWTEIEIARDPVGGTRVVFHGGMKDTPAARAVTSIDVSVAHEGHLAMATAVALIEPDVTPGPHATGAMRQEHTQMSTDVTARIRAILAETGGIPSAADIGEGDNLYDAGLTSHASVNVMLALEDEFDIEFPDELLRKSTFSTIDNIAAALEEIG